MAAVPAPARRWWRLLRRSLLALTVVLVALLLLVRLRYGGGRDGFPERLGPPLPGVPALEEVASLPLPAGNIAVSANGRVFFSMHPEARPAVKMVELVGGQPRPFPDASWQGPRGEGDDGVPLPFFDTPLGVRIDEEGRLWTVDNANHGLGQPRLLAFDVASGRLLARFDVGRELAPLGSHLNDLQVTPDGRWVFIADASIFGLHPALLVFDVAKGTARRLLAGHPAVTAEPWVPTVGGRRMRIFGLFTIAPGVDSIALDRRGEWLYFAALTARRIYRARVRDLVDEALAPPELARRVESFADKPMTDGLSIDLAGNLVATDFPHAALQLLSPRGELSTLVRDPRLRWPDGLSFGPCGDAGAGPPAAAGAPAAPAHCLYVTCSALHQVIGRTPGQIRRAGPFQVYRLRMPEPGIAGS
jgi:sugar lactone lactonase YvrE